ncbi:MAG: ABC transporter permease, partial [Deltaproteobacteria bacterium]
SAVKLMLTSTVMATLAWLLYSFNIFKLGFPLIPLILNLIVMGWSVGVVTTALILRFGQETEVLAWGVALFFQPFSAVFYPVSILPGWVRNVAFFIPASHVFEGMRAVMSTGALPAREIVIATALNAAYIAASLLFFSWNFKAVKRKGLLARAGE